MNSIHISGRLTRDPELRRTADDIAVANFRIATPRPSNREETDFFSVTAWRQRAEFVAKYFQKGDWIYVQGEVQNETYEDDKGVEHRTNRIVAGQVEFVGDKRKPDGDDGTLVDEPAPGEEGELPF